MTYKLNQEAKAFSYTKEELFECITNIVAHSSSAEARALAIFTVVDDYFTNYVQSDNNGGYCVYECTATDLTDFVRSKLGISDYDGIDVNEVLK
tara:strand:+ start:73 stop:354 length:282 start_codon:yes stop_codon:yes gene_type:complete